MIHFNSSDIIGKDAIWERMDRFAKAVEFILHQTIRYMNTGAHPDEIVQLVSMFSLETFQVQLQIVLQIKKEKIKLPKRF